MATHLSLNSGIWRWCFWIKSFSPKVHPFAGPPDSDRYSFVWSGPAYSEGSVDSIIVCVNVCSQIVQLNEAEKRQTEWRTVIKGEIIIHMHMRKLVQSSERHQTVSWSLGWELSSVPPRTTSESKVAYQLERTTKLTKLETRRGKNLRRCRLCTTWGGHRQRKSNSWDGSNRQSCTWTFLL
jgi:hypothetical protein